MKSGYLINQETISLISYFDDLGFEHSRVIEGSKTFLVRQSPEKILDETLQYLGSSFDGAMRGAKAILGNKYRLPISISPSQGITWFPCNSFRSKESIWLANSHIEYLERVLPSETIVHMSQGHALNIRMRKKQIEERMGRSAVLQSKLKERSTKKMLFLYEKGSGIRLLKKSGEMNFLIQSKERID